MGEGQSWDSPHPADSSLPTTSRKGTSIQGVCVCVLCAWVRECNVSMCIYMCVCVCASLCAGVCIWYMHVCVWCAYVCTSVSLCVMCYVDCVYGCVYMCRCVCGGYTSVCVCISVCGVLVCVCVLMTQNLTGGEIWLELSSFGLPRSWPQDPGDGPHMASLEPQAQASPWFSLEPQPFHLGKWRLCPLLTVLEA